MFSFVNVLKTETVKQLCQYVLLIEQTLLTDGKNRIESPDYSAKYHLRRGLHLLGFLQEEFCCFLIRQLPLSAFDTSFCFPYLICYLFFTIMYINSLGGRSLQFATLQVEILMRSIITNDVHNACRLIWNIGVALETVGGEVDNGIIFIIVSCYPFLENRPEPIGAQRLDGRV